MSPSNCFRARKPRRQTETMPTPLILDTKLEEMVRITEKGCELIGVFPFEDDLLG